MKKLFAALLSLCMILAAFSAGAEEGVTIVNWSDLEDQAADVEGQFAEISNIGLKMFIPDVFRDTELSEETLADGTFIVLKTENENAVVNAQIVPTDIDQFRALLADAGHSSDEIIVNGIPFFQFSVAINGIVSVSFAAPTNQNQVLVFSFAPADQEAYAGLFRLMAGSIQTID